MFNKINEFNLWKITARVIGEKMPKMPLKVGSCILEKLTIEEQRKLVLSSERPDIGIKGEAECYMTHITSDNKKIKSDYFISTQISADSNFEAEEKATKLFEEALSIISLGSVCTNWYEFLLCGINRVTKKGIVNKESVVSFGARVPYNLIPDEFDKEDFKRIGLLKEIKDIIFDKSLYYLGLAEKRLNTDLTRAEDRLEVDVFLNFFKVIELISNKLANNKNISVNKEQLEQLLIKFTEDFKKEDNIDEQSTLIGNCQRDMSVLRGEYLSEKIKNVGKLLDINKEIVDIALKYNKIRNSSDITHAHISPPAIKINYAELSNSARNFLEGYIEYIS